jgi:hypothetical protein
MGSAPGLVDSSINGGLRLSGAERAEIDQHRIARLSLGWQSR